MAQMKQLKATDGHTLDAYVVRPEGQARGAVVVLQEIFGVNAHIRSVVDRFALAGYVAIAPSLFDRAERGVELRYEGADMQKAVSLMHQLDPATALLDIAAAYAEVRNEGKGVGVVGFCYGGFLSWITATRGVSVGMHPNCCVAYYPGGIGKVAAEIPACAVMIHLGTADSHIDMGQIEAVKQAHPDVSVFLYEGAQHGFNCDARSSFSAADATLAWERTLDLLRRSIG